MPVFDKSSWLLEATTLGVVDGVGNCARVHIIAVPTVVVRGRTEIALMCTKTTAVPALIHVGNRNTGRPTTPSRIGLLRGLHGIPGTKPINGPSLQDGREKAKQRERAKARPLPQTMLPLDPLH